MHNAQYLFSDIGLNIHYRIVHFGRRNTVYEQYIYIYLYRI
jgi:hypothetical protein